MNQGFVMNCATGEVEVVSVPPPSFEDRKASLQASVGNRRWQAETGGIAIGGTTIRTDAGSQAKIAGAVTLFDNDPTLLSIDWEAQPGEWVALDEATMRTIGVAVGRHVQACFSHARTLSEAIEAAADDAALDAIDVEAGWPA